MWNVIYNCFILFLGKIFLVPRIVLFTKWNYSVRWQLMANLREQRTFWGQFLTGKRILFKHIGTVKGVCMDLYKVVWMCMNWNKDLCFYLIWHFLFTQNFLGIQDAALIGSTVNIFIWKKFTIAHKSPDRRDKILDLFSSSSKEPK